MSYLRIGFKYSGKKYEHQIIIQINLRKNDDMKISHPIL